MNIGKHVAVLSGPTVICYTDQWFWAQNIWGYITKCKSYSIVYFGTLRYMMVHYNMSQYGNVPGSGPLAFPEAQSVWLGQPAHALLFPACWLSTPGQSNETENKCQRYKNVRYMCNNFRSSTRRNWGRKKRLNLLSGTFSTTVLSAILELSSPGPRLPRGQVLQLPAKLRA